MKKTAIWKVIVLTIITGGLYSIFWFARNRKYLVTKKGEKIPTWPWLLAIPVVYGVGCIAGFVHIINAVLSTVDVDTAIHSYMMSIFIGCLFGAGIYLTWLWTFSEAMEKVTQGRLSRPVALVLGLFTGPFLIVFYQYYINRLSDNKKDQQYTVSTKLMVITGIIMALGILSIVSTVANLNETNAVIKNEIVKTREGFSTVQKLNADYLKCDAKLKADYPNGATDDNREAYASARDECMKIYDEYQDTLNKYIKGDL